MAKRARAIEPMYRVWRPDLGETEQGDCREYGALDVASAARRYAEDGANHRDWEHFPVVVHVRVIDPQQVGHAKHDKVFVVEVEQHMVPEYIAGKPLPLEMEPAVHALCSGRPICNDIRLGHPPATWPEGQTWVDLRNFENAADGSGGRISKAAKCETCARRAKLHINGLKQIGAWK